MKITKSFLVRHVWSNSAAAVLLALSLLSAPVQGEESGNNFYQYDGRDYRHLVNLWGFAPRGSHDFYAGRLLAFPVEKFLSPLSLTLLTPSQLRLIFFHNFDDKMGQAEAVAYSIVRDGAILTPDAMLKSGDVLLLKTPDTKGDNGWVPSYCLFYNQSSEEKGATPQSNYGAIPATDLTNALSPKDDGDTTGYVDWSPEIDLAWPGVLIQCDGASSAQWGLWYEWTLCSRMYGGWPRNVLEYLSTLNLGDNSQYPEDYLEFYASTGIENAKTEARRSLETLLKYRLPSAPAKWPFGIFPWKDRVWNANEPLAGTPLAEGHGGENVFAWRSIAVSERFFLDDPEFSKQLEEQYKNCRNAFFVHLDNHLDGLNDAGTALEAVAAHYALTRSAADRKDLTDLADGMLGRHRRGLEMGYGSEMPKYVMGLVAAYLAVGNQAYLDEAKSFALHELCPSLWRNRQFYNRDPHTEDRDPDFVAGHWEGIGFLRLFLGTKDPFFIAMAAMEWGSYEPAAWNGKDLFHRWEGGPSSEANFFYLHRYAVCLKNPNLYKDMEVFRGNVPLFSDWKKWPLVVRADNVTMEIQESGKYDYSPELNDASTQLLMLNGGKGGGLYRPGTVVDITAKPAVGQVFDKWEVNFGGPSVVADVHAAATKATMPDSGPAGITAKFHTDPSLLHIIGLESPDSGHSMAKAFDDDLYTSYQGPDADASWVGLDLGSSKVVTDILYASWPGRAGVMVHGKFQGSNVPDFSSGVVDLDTIVRAPEGGMNEHPINNPYAARYIRYLGPSGSHSEISEMKIYAVDAPASAAGASTATPR